MNLLERDAKLSEACGWTAAAIGNDFALSASAFLHSDINFFRLAMYAFGTAPLEHCRETAVRAFSAFSALAIFGAGAAFAAGGSVAGVVVYSATAGPHSPRQRSATRSTSWSAI